MNKILYVLVAIAILVSMPVQALAEDYTVDKKIFVNEEYGYTYSEEINTNKKTVRTYENPTVMELKEQLDSLQRISNYNVEVPSEEKFAVIKSVLTDLGMPDDIANNLSEDSLENYCRSPKIVTVETMSSDRKFNDTVTEQGDDYLMWFTYAFLFEEDYHYAGYQLSTYFHYLTDIPQERYGESLGIAVTDCIVVSDKDTLSGFHTYYPCTYSADGSEEMGKSVRVEDEVEVFLGNTLCGTGIQFQFPTGNYYTSALTGNKVGTDYVGGSAYLEMIAIVKQYTIEQVFNAVATYDHLVEKYEVIPNLSISAGTSGADISVGFSVEKSLDKETEKLMFKTGIQHVPIIVN